MRMIDQHIKSNRLLQLLVAISMALVVLAYVYATFFLHSLHLQTNALISSGVMIACLVLHLLVAKRSYWSPSFIFIFIYCLFHFGLVVMIALNLASDIHLGMWARDYQFNQAILLVSLGLASYVIGVVLSGVILGAEHIERAFDADDGLQGVVVWIGFGLVLVSVATWFAMAVYYGGWQILTSPYLTFLSVTEGSGIWFFYFPLGVGLIFLVAAEPAKLRTTGFGIFVVFAMVAFPLGLRGEVLFPMAAAAAMLGMKGRPFSLPVALLVLVLLLSLIAFIRVVRDDGLSGFEYTATQLRPADALTEMGGSIRPVVEILKWHEAGEGYLYGQSYLAPFDRLLVYFIPGWSRLPADEDQRLLNVVIQKRVGPIGFSIVAEAFKNGGMYGVIIVMGLLGMLFGSFDNLHFSRMAQIVLGLSMFPLLGHIRNAFTQVPFQWLLGFLVLAIAVTLARIRCQPIKDLA